MIDRLTISVERSGVWRISKILDSRARPLKGEAPLQTRPVRGVTESGAFLSRTFALPLATASVRSVDCRDVLEFVRDEDLLIDELARVLAPGGRLTLRVPATGLLGAFDAYNLGRYLVDISRRGARPHETSELGWRRHYRRADLDLLLGAGRFEVERIERRRLGIAELIAFAGHALFRWRRPKRNRYRQVKQLAHRVERLEDRLASPIGTVIELTAIRTGAPHIR